jgi:RHH-type rel operon transcriptional repressor/antitoxin RelB
MLGVRLPEDLNNRLTALSEKTHRPKSYYVKEALEKYLEDVEDYLLAVQAYEEHLREGGQTISLKDMMKKYKIEAN